MNLIKCVFSTVYILINLTSFVRLHSCGLDTAGAIVQQVTNEKVKAVSGLYWINHADKLMYVSKFDGKLCMVKHEGDDKCFKIEGIKSANGAVPIKKVKNKLILLADRKVILLNLNISKQDEITSINAEDLFTISEDEKSSISKFAIDNHGRIWTQIDTITSENARKSTLYKINEQENILEVDVGIDMNGGLIFSKHSKYLFISDLKEKVIYKFDYNNKKGVLGKREMIFNLAAHEITGNPCAITATEHNLLWISMCDTGHIVYVNWKKNRIEQTIKIPTSFGWSLDMGGKNYNILFVGTTTTYYKESADEEPGAGYIYAVCGTGTVGYENKKVAMFKSVKQKRDLIGLDNKAISLPDIERMITENETQDEE